MSEKRTRTRTPTNNTTTGFRISDELWEVLQPLLPEASAYPPTGWRSSAAVRPSVRRRHFLRLAHRLPVESPGCDRFGSTAHDRFQAWVKAGVFLKRWQVEVERFDAWKGIDWEWLSMDGAITTAPLGGADTGKHPTDRGKHGTKSSLLTEGHGGPIGLAVEGANRHAMKLVRETIENIVGTRPEPTEEHPQHMGLDKGYD